MKSPIRFQNKSGINYSDIDDGIRGLIRSMNQVPFLRTLSCCQGHIREQFSSTFPDHPDSQAIGLPNPGYTYLFEGYIACCIDDSFSQVRDFQYEISHNLFPKHPHVVARRGYNPFTRELDNYLPSELEFELWIDASDLTEKVLPGDKNFVRWRKSHHVRRDLAEARLEEHWAVWKELHQIVEKYVHLV